MLSRAAAPCHLCRIAFVPLVTSSSHVALPSRPCCVAFAPLNRTHVPTPWRRRRPWLPLPLERHRIPLQILLLPLPHHAVVVVPPVRPPPFASGRETTTVRSVLAYAARQRAPPFTHRLLLVRMCRAVHPYAPHRLHHRSADESFAVLCASVSHCQCSCAPPSARHWAHAA